MAVTTGNERRLTDTARSLGAIVDFATRSHASALLVLTLAVFLNILPGFFQIPPIDRDEARFAQATKQMIETGDYVDIHFQDEVRYKKPVGVYWLQAAVVNAAIALGVPHALATISLYRVPSLAGALSAVLLTYWTALAFVSRRAAVLAGLMLASCLLLNVEGRLAKTDALLLMTVVAAMGALARTYLPEQRTHLGGAPSWTVPAIFWTALAAGVLLKGPVILLFVGLAAVTLTILDRSARWMLALRPVYGLIWFVVLVLPWFALILNRAGESFIVESAGQDMLAKVFSGQEGHGAPPGTYAVLFWLTFWPAATLAGLAVPAVWAARREPGAKFLLAWVVPSWLLFELVVTKLPHYVLPTYPAIAILLAGIVDARMLSNKVVLVRGTMAWFVVPAIVGVAGLVTLMVIGRQFGFFAWLFTGASLVMGLSAWRLYEADGAESSLLRGIAASILSSIALFGLILPSVSPLFPSATLSKILRESGCAAPVAASVNYHEPSLVFLAGTGTLLADPAHAAEFLRGGGCRFAFVDTRQERNFAIRADAIGLRYAPGPRFEAINHSNGQWMTIAVYRSVEAVP